MCVLILIQTLILYYSRRPWSYVDLNFNPNPNPNIFDFAQIWNFHWS
jgi:hypothetical protein